jgi:hypothetical protein
MPSNSQTLLNGILDKDGPLLAPTLSESKFFELFASEHILKNYGLSYDEIFSGIVGDGGDGGVDSIYTFVNGVLAAEDTNFTNIKQNGVITLYIIQSKKTNGFSDEAILRLDDTCKDLLNLSHPLDVKSKKYNPRLLRSIAIFRGTYTQLLKTSPKLQIIFWYATLADDIHPNVEDRSDLLKQTVKQLFTDCEVEFHFCGADKLFTLYRKSKVENLPLTVTEIMPTQLNSPICLVNLKEYFNFIHDPETGELRSWLFEENVRDYEGRSIEVNRAIRISLESSNPAQDFWWLNNGITVVATKAPLSGKTISVTDPKIVNGLQTSMEIYNYFRVSPKHAEDRNILVRIVVADDQEIRNSIIKATNSQSSISAASLRSFDPIHHKIEQYFLLQDLFYDRRKNYYKNQGKAKEKIVTIPYLAQAVAAIWLQRPNDSRGRPIRLLKDPDLYDRIFSEANDVNLYLRCILFMKKIDEFLSSDSAPKYVIDHEINVRFQLAMFAAVIKTNRMHPQSKHILSDDFLDIDTALLADCLKHVWGTLRRLRGKKQDIDENRVAKSPQFDAKLKELLHKIVVTNKQQFDRDVEKHQETKMRPIQKPAFSKEASVQPSNKDSSTDSPCQFLDYKSPKNKVERFAVVARFRELKEGVASSLRNDFEAICKACGINFERDKFSDDMKHGREAGLFSHIGNMVDGFPLSSFGQKYVDLLPDRDALKKLRKSKPNVQKKPKK